MKKWVFKPIIVRVFILPTGGVNQKVFLPMHTADDVSNCGSSPINTRGRILEWTILKMTFLTPHHFILNKAAQS
ncbi:hypothetical protein [Bacillus sonorensis]|uniref:hypothetical protein n=1 Tax=Bacillus sonorensis TaxID=119858 RepID=UPI001ABF3090|nr:hypothetical protein [Bacillus sonorensis]